MPSRGDSLPQLGCQVVPIFAGTLPSGFYRRVDEQIALDVGAKVQCYASFDSLPHPAEIVGHKTDVKGYSLFYVHYLDCDKRLDEWVPATRLTAGTAVVTTHALLERAPSIKPLIAANGELISPAGCDQKITRRLKRKIEDLHHVPSGVDEQVSDHGFEKEHQERNKVKNIKVVEMGNFEMETWYHSPYPEPYASCEKLYICEYSLKYFQKRKTLLRHLAKLDMRHPPGDEIYRSPPPPHSNPTYTGGSVANPQIAVWEVDGKKMKIYCQNLCLLSKLFLDHKTLYYDVDPFLFYVLCERDEQGGNHLVGYFSKEKNCAEDYNLACILTLPAYQRKGYGKFLIAFSYELSKKENKIGTPERPLSDLGQVSFRSFWTRVLLEMLRNTRDNITLRDLSELTKIKVDDIVYTLQGLNMLKYWRGQHFISVNMKTVEEHLAAVQSQRFIEIDPACLHWQPLPSPTLNKKPKAK